MVPCVNDERDCKKCLENILIEYCSPSLAGLKAANLVNLSFLSKACLEALLKEANDLLDDKGMRLRVLSYRENHALILCYRSSALVRHFSLPGTKQFLHFYGYEARNLEEDLTRLSLKMEADSFPHEIGIFLGYPLEDVVGFIKNDGKNPLLSGYWKVYSAKEQALKKFHEMDLCVKRYKESYRNGKSLYSLVV